MTATATIVLHRLTFPDTVPGHFKSDESAQEIRVPLKDLTPSALERLCDEFREDMFKLAGKDRPQQVMCMNLCQTCGKTVI